MHCSTFAVLIEHELQYLFRGVKELLNTEAYKTRILSSDIDAQTSSETEK